MKMRSTMTLSELESELNQDRISGKSIVLFLRWSSDCHSHGHSRSSLPPPPPPPRNPPPPGASSRWAHARRWRRHLRLDQRAEEIDVGMRRQPVARGGVEQRRILLEVTPMLLLSFVGLDPKRSSYLG